MSGIGKLNSWAGLWEQVRGHMHAVGAHPAQTVVLLPFFQLQAVARGTWAESEAGKSSGFSPRIETTTSWQRRTSHFAPDALDVSFDAALDAVRARGWLSRAGLKDHSALLTPRLVEAAQQLGALAAAIEPGKRAAWASRLRDVVNVGAEAFANYEAAVSRIALEWAAASSYAGDVLFDAALSDQLQALVVVRGVQRNALSEHLVHQLGEKALMLDLPQSECGQVSLQTADDMEDEAQRAAACILAHLAAGRFPVALPAIDRLAARRISAMLSERGISVLDETGWKLSTTRAAGNLMSLLRAASIHATWDEQLDWLKHCDVDQALVQRFEHALRKQNGQVAGIHTAQSAIEFIVNEMSLPWPQLLANLRRDRSLMDWLRDFQTALQISGQWAHLRSDAAGEQIIKALHWGSPDAQIILQSDASRMSLGEFSTWVQTALEGASFKPTLPAGEPQVVILPLAQLAARPFAAAVIAGCDELRLPAAPDLQGDWTAAQRIALGLPSREALALEQLDVWQRALQVPYVDVLWRLSESDEPLQASPLLRAWLRDNTPLAGADARQVREVQAQPAAMPAPPGDALLKDGAISLSASSYQDLRACPYRYFALRLLGLQEAQELDEAVSKRDFGAWLHAVLSDFHEQRLRESDAQMDRALLDTCALKRQQDMLSDEAGALDAGFVPFAASWPQVRESYLLWLAKHEAESWRFESSELDARRELDASVVLKGRLDRVDVLGGSGAQSYAVIDYKTESDASLKMRVADPLEDTQLVFYAALLGKDSVHASYLGLGEKEAKEVPQKSVNEALPLLLQGVQIDSERIALGHGLPALGEGKACEYCAARGLCRRDFWAESA